MRAWLVVEVWQKLCFLFLFTVTALTIVRAISLAWWLRSRASVGRSHEFDEARALRVWLRSKRLVRSTYGLAQAALWFTGAGAAIGMYTAGIVIENTSRSMLAIIAEQSLDVLDATGIGLALCSLLFLIAWVFDGVVDRGWTRLPAPSREALLGDSDAQISSSRDRIHWTVDRARRLLWAMAILLVAATLLEIRVTSATEMARNEGFVGSAVFALWQLWSRLALLFAAIGGLTWLSVLLEGAASRRMRPA